MRGLTAGRSRLGWASARGRRSGGRGEAWQALKAVPVMGSCSDQGTVRLKLPTGMDLS